MTSNSLGWKLNNIMGVAESTYPHTFLTQLTFIETCQDKHFGAIDLYRTKESPYEYVMDFKKTFIEENERVARHLRVVGQLKHMEHKNLAKIHHSELIEQNQLCIKHKIIHTFSSFYNFTLEAAVQKKKLQDSCFPENELVYVMGCLLDLALFLRQFGLSAGQYRSQSIFLSPEGYVKAYLLQADEQNRHSCYFKVLGERSLIQNYIFAPQQLQALSNLEYQTKYDVYKADLFAIAMLTLQLVTLDKPKFYYNADRTALKLDRIAFDISSMSTHYSEGFISLLRSCLNANPNDRFDLAQAAQELAAVRKRLRSPAYCVRLQEEECKNGRKNNREAKTTKSDHFLKALQKKLAPSPISTMTSSSQSITHMGSLTLATKTQSAIRQ